MTIPTDEFETMCARARSFRRRVDELGTVSSPVIDGYVRDRLLDRPYVSSLPPAQGELAEEILGLLQMPGLSPQQSHRIMREFFGAQAWALVGIVLRIGAGESPLEEAEALWLESTIRKTCIDAFGRPWDREAAAALHVADVLDKALARGAWPEPIEVGRPAALGLLNVFHDKDADDVFARVARSEGVAALYLALRRFVRDAA